MSLFGKIFGSDKALDKVVDTAGKLVDEAFYTKEEKALDLAKAQTEARGMIVEWMRATEGQRLSRRLIALSITGMWLFMFMIAAALDVAAIWVSQETAIQVVASSASLDERTGIMSTAVTIILGFYFSAPFMGDISKAALEKFSQRGT